MMNYDSYPRLSVDIDLNYIGSVDQDTMRNERQMIVEAIFKIMQQNNFDLERSPNHYDNNMLHFYVTYKYLT